ncbi:MAG TPA: TrpB-like pyridoxal phosphate-dependent enzyme [Chloroflexi bacterium]|jgi:tryptophan synthase beta chain|nr:TrpB-like pyridoxal phosphate-dependent enzyme [Chloroflexota bacterium]
METRFDLSQSDMPRRWYNAQADLAEPLPPPLHPGTLQPISLADLEPLFPKEIIRQEMSQERYIDIPEEVQEVLRLWRPTPLLRAVRLEKALGTPAKIFYKYEGTSPTGSHKPNTAVAQAFYNKIAGVRKLTTETGAGQWGTALAMASNFFGLECKVFMVKVSYQQKPYRRSIMQMFGASVTPSPSTETEAGRSILAKDPDSTGSLGIAISEACEIALQNDDTKYSLGSVLNHVLMHQTIIGEETILQMDKAGFEPDVVIGCVGGGSNFGGIALPYLRRNLQDGTKVRLVGVEPMACPTMTKGVYAFDYGDTAKMAPVVKMNTLGHDFVPAGIHAGGLRYHGVAPLLAALHRQGHIEAVAYHQTPVFDAAALFTRTEGIIPAPESAHAIRAAIDEALDAREKGEERVIVFCLSGHGYIDLGAYDLYMDGKLEDYAYPEEKIRQSLANLPQVSL